MYYSWCSSLLEHLHRSTLKKTTISTELGTEIRSYMLAVQHLLSKYIRVYLDRLFAPLTDTPHAARSARKAQKRSIRISSPADDCSKIRLKTPRRPGFLRPEYGRRSRTYFPEREETPNPQGQINLRCSTAESLRGSPCSSQDTSNEPNARAGKGKKNGRRGTANGNGTG